MNQLIQPQEQAQALMVQAQWLVTAISIIMGVLMVIDFIATMLKLKGELGD